MSCKFPLLHLLAAFMACAWIQPVTATYSFINPASHGGQTSFANNNVYAEKAILEVQWTVGATDEDATVVLWQVNTTSTTASNSDEPEFIGDLEYLAEGQAPDRNSRRWIVVTNKDLNISPVFLMMILVTGNEAASDWTVYFNITSSSSSSDGSSATSTSTTSTATTATSAIASSSSPSSSSKSTSTSARVILSIGIPAAAIAGFLAGLGAFLAFRRKRSNDNNNTNTRSNFGGDMQQQQQEEEEDLSFKNDQENQSKMDNESNSIVLQHHGHVASNSLSKVSHLMHVSPRSASSITKNDTYHQVVYEASNEPPAATVSDLVELYAPHNHMEARYRGG